MLPLSVIIPVYNGEQVLPVCLRRLVWQGFEDFEIIIVDNNATDRSAVVAGNFAKMDRRVRCISCAKQGVSAARNAGLDAARGQYVYFVDADDDLHRETLRRLFSMAKKTGADLLSTNIMYVRRGVARPMDPSTSDVYAKGTKIPALYYDKLPYYVLCPPFKLYKRQFLTENNIRFDEDLSLGEDLLFNIECFRRAGSVYYIAQPLYYYEMAGGGLSSRYRPDFIDIKTRLAGEIRDYLSENGLLGPNYYAILLNDLFAIISNELQNGGSPAHVYSLPLTRELLGRGAGRVGSIKRLFLALVRLRATPLLRLMNLAYRWNIKRG